MRMENKTKDKFNSLFLFLFLYLGQLETLALVTHYIFTAPLMVLNLLMFYTNYAIRCGDEYKGVEKITCELQSLTKFCASSFQKGPLNTPVNVFNLPLFFSLHTHKHIHTHTLTNTFRLVLRIKRRSEVIQM